MKATDQAKELVRKYGEILAPKVVDEIIEVLLCETDAANYYFWCAVKEELTFKSE
jgi:hypothetical protein